MTLAQVYTMLTSMTGFTNKVAFDEYPQTQAQSLPYINLQSPNTTTFGADNKVYFTSPNINIEFYSKQKDLANEALIETTLNSNDLYWKKTEGRIDSQSCYQVIYEIGV